MKTKSVSIFAVFFVLFLVIFETPKIEAQDSECLKEFGGNIDFSLCAPKIYPPFCYTLCREIKGAKSGICDWNAPGGVKCFCDYCNEKPYLTLYNQ